MENVVPGIKNHKTDLLFVAKKLQKFMREHTVIDFNQLNTLK